MLLGVARPAAHGSTAGAAITWKGYAPLPGSVAGVRTIRYVLFVLQPPVTFKRGRIFTTWPRSSIGQSACLLNGKMQVRILPGPSLPAHSYA